MQGCMENFKSGFVEESFLRNDDVGEKYFLLLILSLSSSVSFKNKFLSFLFRK